MLTAVPGKSNRIEKVTFGDNGVFLKSEKSVIKLSFYFEDVVRVSYSENGDFDKRQGEGMLLPDLPLLKKDDNSLTESDEEIIVSTKTLTVHVCRASGAVKVFRLFDGAKDGQLVEAPLFSDFMDREKRKTGLFVIILLIIILLVTATLSLLLGRFDISVRECFGIIFSKILPIEPFWTKVQNNMLMMVRLPRVVIAVLVGASLSVAGTSYQCIFRNPMSAPDILGASTGAAFGAALSILLQKSYMEITAWAFISSMICVLLVLFVSSLCKGNQILNLILAGIMVGSLF